MASGLSGSGFRPFFSWSLGFRVVGFLGFGFLGVHQFKVSGFRAASWSGTLSI